jgi:hypothetical protein
MSSVSARKRRGKHKNSDRTFLYILAAFFLVVVAVIFFLNRPASPAPVAGPPPAATFDESELLPLAEPVKPIHGFHDMPRIPQGPIPTRTVAENAPQANVDLPLTRWDWGTIPRKPPVSQNFPIQNTGTEPLVISNVVTSCGCTTADLSSSVIPPGQRADLLVTFDPDYHKDAVGPVTRIVWVETNDPDMPLLELRVDANVLK